MIKRVIGLLAAAAVVAVVVLTVLHRDRYRSMVEPAPSAEQQLPAQPEAPEPAPAQAASTLLSGPEAEAQTEE